MVSNPSKIAILISGSPVFDSGVLPLLPENFFEGKYVVAIDKGLEFAWKYQLPVDILIGDRDSVDLSLLKFYPNILQQTFPSRKNHSDTELALNFVKEQGFLKIYGLNMIGGRLDHDLFHRILLTQHPDLFWMLSSQGSLCALSPNTPHEFLLSKGSIFSIIPLINCENLTLSGCEYPLSNYDLGPGTLTLSNISHGKVSLHFTSGNLLFFIDQVKIL